MFLFLLKFPWLQRLLLNETMNVSSWNVGHVFKTAWSSWSLIWEQDGRNVNFISHIHVHFLSSVISLIVLPTFSAIVVTTTTTTTTTTVRYRKLTWWLHYIKTARLNWNKLLVSTFFLYRFVCQYIYVDCFIKQFFLISLRNVVQIQVYEPMQVYEPVYSVAARLVITAPVRRTHNS